MNDPWALEDVRSIPNTTRRQFVAIAAGHEAPFVKNVFHQGRGFDYHIDPLQASLGVSNASFVAQTADWVPAHMYATMVAAYDHPGFSFVRILQRCPKFTPDVFQDQVQNPDLTELLVHENGVDVPALEQLFKARRLHDPLNMDEARSLANRTDKLRLGVFFRDDNRPVYEEVRAVPKVSAEEKVARLNKEFERYAV